MCRFIVRWFIERENREIKIMQGLDDLKEAVGSLATTVGAVKLAVATLNTQIATLQATIAAGGDNDADVETQAQAIAKSVSDLNGIINPTTPNQNAPAA